MNLPIFVIRCSLISRHLFGLCIVILLNFFNRSAKGSVFQFPVSTNHKSAFICALAT